MEIQLNFFDYSLLCPSSERKKKSIKDIFNSYMKYLTSNEKIKEVNLKEIKSDLEVKRELVQFIDEYIMDFNSEGAYCIDICEEEGNYHMTSYWIEDVYNSVRNYLSDNYTDVHGYILKEIYKGNISALKEKMEKFYSGISEELLSCEILASILLDELQHYPIWYTIYGTEEEDMIDFRKYEITSALVDADNFPILKSEDLVAAMYGINNTVQPSDMYGIFAHYADKLKKPSEEISLFYEKEDYIFTPDTFLVAGVNARWKNYMELKKISKGLCCSDYLMEYHKLDGFSSVSKDFRNVSILQSIINDYISKFSEAPIGLPILRDMIKEEYKGNYYEIQYRIRGIRNMRNEWVELYKGTYNIPYSAEEYQNLIFQVAIDFRRELLGMEKEKYSNLPAIEGKYPNKYSATHGLKFVKDINVRYKNSRGFDEKKTPVTNYDLALAEKQSLYLIKKSLRYATKNPVLSTSFGIDSTITQHLLRRVAKHSYNVVHNDSLVEYSDVVKYRNWIIKEWGIENRITTTKPVKTYWQMVELNGFNFARKGDRRKGASPSEQCCANIKHIPMYKYIDRLIEEGNPMQVNYSGLRAFESREREQQVKRDGVVYYAKSWKSIRVNPIAFFTDNMVWDYVKKYNVPYCSVYDKILYYEDVFDNISEEEYGKVLYKPRVGCWCCMVTAKSYYLHWLRKYFPSQYEFLMIKKGMAKEIFSMGAKKLGIIADFNIVKEKKNDNQISLFDNADENNLNTITSEEILEKYPIEAMENMIMRRPCKFLS